MNMFFLIAGIFSCVAGLLLLRNQPQKNENARDQLFLHYLAVAGLLITGIGELVTFALLAMHA